MRTTVLTVLFFSMGSIAVAEPGIPRSALRDTLDVEWLSPDERAALHRAHGVWDEDDLRNDDDRLAAALVVGDLRDDTVLTDDVSPLLAGEWLAARGQYEEALGRLEGLEDARARLRVGDILFALDRDDEARAAWESASPGSEAASRTAAVTALRRLAELDQARSGAYQQLMQAYGSIRERDPFDWTSRLQEAELLMEKYNPSLAFEAIQEVLELNPRLGAAWLMLGRLNLMRFDFDRADAVVAALRDLSPGHPMADLLEGESLLIQHDPQGALERARRIRLAVPWWLEGMALELSALAVLADPDLEATMQVYEDRYPGSALAAYRTGASLSFQRQYPESDRWLRRAIEIQPAWPAPWIDLGLMQWQDARMEDATETLRQAVVLDEFNRRSANSLALLEELEGYATVDTPHFLIRYAPGIDELLVQEMVQRVDVIHDDITAAFEWQPERKTVIELYPDHERFAVRIIGMPDIHTVAACTGPCVAMETPQLGVPSEHMGIYDWERVLRHEYAHTVNLAQTDYRVPLWFTEAAAVWTEPGPRKWQTSQMLAEELAAGTLLTMDEISWGFVRPRRPQDRALAYAQSNWMLEFIIERWGHDAMIAILSDFREGRSLSEALRRSLGVDEADFFELFLDWARGQVASWGLLPEPTLADLLAGEDEAAIEVRAMEQSQAELEHFLRGLHESIGEPARTGQSMSLFDTSMPASIDDDDTLLRLLASHPDHPDVLEAAVFRSLEGGALEGHEMVDLATAYVAVRPGDPAGHEALARWWMEQDDPGRAAESIAVIVAQEEYDPLVARRLSRAWRLAGRFEDGAEAMERSIGISPFDPGLREEAAAAAIEAAQLSVARRHLEALVMLEPDQPLHKRRLQALEAMLEE
ncbi:MAG: hypothetical protein MK116_13455 [Phycisphaerales bacterium]|nr:hypothetical protein [Phycisphaerales bacterium]